MNNIITVFLSFNKNEQTVHNMIFLLNVVFSFWWELGAVAYNA
jgi:hypothetical protein